MKKLKEGDIVICTKISRDYAYKPTIGHQYIVKEVTVFGKHDTWLRVYGGFFRQVEAYYIEDFISIDDSKELFIGGDYDK